MALNIYRSMDKVMLGILSNIETTGIYENGEKLIYCLSCLIASFGTIMMPKLSKLVEQKKYDEIHEYIYKSMKLMIIMTSALSFGLMSVSNILIPILFGSDFNNSSYVLFLCAPTLIFMGWSNVIRMQYIIPMKKDKIYIRSIAYGSVVNLILNLLLIPKLSITGAIIGTLAALAHR